MRRIAYCSPLNPVQSGISDYSEELLPYLGAYAEISVFVERGLTPSNPQVQRHLEVRAIDELPALHQRRPFDAIIYHMGNSPAHAAIYDMALRLPGVIVLHEWVLHHFKLWYAAERRRDITTYIAEMRRRYGEHGERVARRMSRGQLLEAAFRFPLVEDLVAGAQGVIGHSRFVVEQARRVRPDLPAAVVPMGVPLPPPHDPRAARAALGLPVAAPLWASFGHLNPYKRLEAALRAFRRFREAVPEARYLLVGSLSPAYDLPGLIRRLELSDAVVITGYVPRAAFERYVAAADVCLNLRFPTAGETSASLLRLLGAGKPTLVSAVGAFAELPRHVVAHVDVDRSEAALILAYTRLFWRFPAIAAQLGHNARSYVAREHSLPGAAQGYIRFLSELYGWGPTPPQRAVLWSVEPERDAPSSRVSGGPGLDAPAVADASRGPLGQTIAAVGAAAAELGLRPADETALRAIATTLGDLLGEVPRRDRV